MILWWDGRGILVALQVKSTIFELEEGWMCTVASSGKPYPPGSFDFLVGYIVYEDAWYIIPEEEVRGMKSVSLHTNNSHSKYEKYREAWELLHRDLKPESETGEVGDIHGCAEEFLAEWSD